MKDLEGNDLDQLLGEFSSEELMQKRIGNAEIFS
jgi:hypothetical protein